MPTLFRIELLKIFRKPRSYIGFVAITVIVLLIQLAFKADGNSYLRFGMQGLTNAFDIGGHVLNGYLICYIILQTLLLQVPLLIALVAGDMIAGEANMGTLRMLMTKPVSRPALLLAKFAATVVYTLALLLLMAVLALFLSLLIFGKGDLFILRATEGIVIRQGDVFWRYAMAFLFASVAMTAVAALAFFLSVFADNAIGPIVATMSVIIVFTILSTMDIPFFDAIRPYLFTTHMTGWKGFFYNPIPWKSVEESTLILVGHIVGLVGLGIWWFSRKDILS